MELDQPSGQLSVLITTFAIFNQAAQDCNITFDEKSTEYIITKRCDKVG